jgi:hypothetical protein
MGATPAMLTMVYLIPVSIWWFTQMSVLTSSPEQFSLQVLGALLIMQVLCLCLFVPQWVRPQERLKQGATAIAASLLPCWPLFAMLWLASGVSAFALVASQAGAVSVGLVVASMAMILQRSRVSEEPLRLLQTSLGLLAATLVFLARTDWLQWITR